MSVRSLRQEEAVERAALLSVSSYDIAIDLTDPPDGPAFRVVSTARFTATPGASTFVVVISALTERSEEVLRMVRARGL